MKMIRMDWGRVEPKKRYEEKNKEILKAIEQTKIDHKERVVEVKAGFERVCWNESYDIVQVLNYRFNASFATEEDYKKVQGESKVKT